MINILMIEDEPDFAKFLGTFLSEYNIKITNYEDPFKGLNCDINQYDLLILDLTFYNGIDGLEICQKIRKNKWHKNPHRKQRGSK